MVIDQPGGPPRDPHPSPEKPQGSRAPGADGARDRLRGHRHQSALCGAGELLRTAPCPCQRGQRPRHPLPRVLDAHDRRHPQVLGVRGPGRQQGRRRDPRPDGPRAEPCQRSHALVRRSAGAVRRGAPVRRRDDHARDLRARRRRGAGGGRARSDRLDRADHRSDPGGHLHGPARWHSDRGSDIRTRDDRLVRDAHCPRGRRYTPATGCTCLRQPVARRAFLR